MKILSERQIDNRVKKIKELEMAISELQAELDSVKDELKFDLQQKGVEEVVTANYKVRYKLINSTRFDTSSFKKDHPDVYDTYAVYSQSRRFAIV